MEQRTYKRNWLPAMELMALRARFYLDQPSPDLLDRCRYNSPGRAACLFRRHEEDRFETRLQSRDRMGETSAWKRCKIPIRPYCRVSLGSPSHSKLKRDNGRKRRRIIPFHLPNAENHRVKTPQHAGG